MRGNCLYTPEQVGLAALVGGPVAGALLVKANYRALGSQPESVLVLAWALLLTYAIVVPGMLGRGAVGIPLAVVLGLGYWRYAARMQGAAIADRLSNGGERQSWWRVVGLSVVVMLATWGLILGGRWVLGSVEGHV